MDVHLIIVALTILMGIAIGWSIGANDAANSLGTAVGAGVLTLRQAIVRISIFGMMGALLQGGRVTKTIGKGIVPLDALGGETATYLALVALFSACAWVVLATYWKMPISTSHSIVGAVGGAGLAVSAPIKWNVMCDIFICWICTPLGAAALGYVLFALIERLAHRFMSQEKSDKIFRWLLVVSGCYVAYSWGANDVANATGVIAGAKMMSVERSVVFGGVAIVLGIMTWGYRVIETIGSNITHLAPIMAFSAELASAVNVHVYTLFGMPVSTSHSIVGAIFGVGLVKGVKTLNLRIMREIVICWIATPFVSGIMAFAVLKLLMHVLRVQL